LNAAKSAKMSIFKEILNISYMLESFTPGSFYNREISFRAPCHDVTVVVITGALFILVFKSKVIYKQINYVIQIILRGHYLALK